MKWKPYPKYKDSGVEWPGEVPEGWGVSAIKRFATFVYGDALPVEARNADGNVPVFGSNGSFGIHDQPNTRAPTILIGRKGSCGALNWSDVPVFAIDTVYFVDNRTCSANLHWFFWSLHTAKLETASQDTGVPGLSREFAHSTMLPVPPEQEQHAITAFLDTETARIDTLITEYETLIDLLKEKRQALISHAVTKGLNPDVPMKDSGVGWLGEVPEHWQVVPLKSLAEFINGDAFNPTEWSEAGLPIIRIQNLNGGEEFNYYEGQTQERYLVRPGDLLFGWSGNRGTSFGPFIWNRSGLYVLNQHIFRVKPRRENAICLYWMLKAVTAHVEEQAHGIIGMVHITKGDLGAIRVPFPLVSEQHAIAAFLDAETSRMDALVQDAENGISLLRERRTTLISDAVTGKIDVRTSSAVDTSGIT